MTKQYWHAIRKFQIALVVESTTDLAGEAKGVNLEANGVRNIVESLSHEVGKFKV